MIVIHILAIIIGVVPVVLTANGNITGGTFDKATGEKIEGGIVGAMPAIAGLVVMASGIGALVQ